MAELPFGDLRPAAAYGLALACLLTALAGRFVGSLRVPRFTPAQRAALLFLGAGYLSWLLTSSIFRYAVVLEIVAGLLLPALLGRFVRGPALAGALVATAALLLTTTRYGPLARRPYGAETLRADMGWVARGTLLVVTFRGPSAYALAFVPEREGVQALQIGTSVLEARGWRLGDEAVRTVREHAGPITVVTEGDPGSRFPELAEIGLSPELANCRAIDSTLTPAGPTGLHACEAARQPPARLTAPFWGEAARHYRTLYQPSTPADDMIATAYLQAVGPAARGTRFLDWADLLWGGLVRDRAALPAALDPGTLYVATPAYAAALAARIDPAHDMLGQADGWVIAAPGWRTCADCTATLPPPTARVPPLGPESPGPLAADILRQGAFGEGWWLDGDPSVWSGAAATLRVPIAANVPPDATLVLSGVAFTAPGLPAQRVTVAAAGHTLTAASLNGRGAVRVPFTPAQLMPAPDGTFVLPLQLSCPDAASPAALGVSPDPRVLGFALTSIRLE